MILVLKQNCSESHIEALSRQVRDLGLVDRRIESGERVMVAAEGRLQDADLQMLQAHPAVERAIPTVSQSPEAKEQALDPHIHVQLRSVNQVVGAERIGVIAGPCSVEDKQQLLETAHAVAEAGAIGLRGGAFKPRTNPYSFQGLGERALELLAEAREQTGLAIVTEVMGLDQVELVTRYADVLQVGTRNMHNFNLLAAVGASGKPILLKRGWAASLDEWLHAAEYIMNEGNRQIILCERGIRTFESYVRNTLPLAVVPAIKKRSPLPVVIDPSQGTGVSEFVGPMSLAAIAAGADGLLIEVHPHPHRAMTDGDQSLDIPSFQQIMSQIGQVAAAIGRNF